MIREIYIDQPWGKDAINVIFPRVVYEVAEQYTAGNIDVLKARQILQKAHQTYERVLTEKGIDTKDELWEIEQEKKNVVQEFISSLYCRN